MPTSSKSKNELKASSASARIPYIPRLMITTLEPLMALGGVLLLLTQPTKYLESTTRGLLMPSAFQPATQFIYTGQAGSWLSFAFIEFFVLRVADDLYIWRVLCAGLLCSDVLFCHSVAQAVGGWLAWSDVSQWGVEDWIATITTWPFVITRILIAAGFWGSGKVSKVE